VSLYNLVCKSFRKSGKVLIQKGPSQQNMLLSRHILEAPKGSMKLSDPMNNQF
jgi:hypothetical protein